MAAEVRCRARSGAPAAHVWAMERLRRTYGGARLRAGADLGKTVENGGVCAAMAWGKPEKNRRKTAENREKRRKMQKSTRFQANLCVRRYSKHKTGGFSGFAGPENAGM